MFGLIAPSETARWAGVPRRYRSDQHLKIVLSRRRNTILHRGAQNHLRLQIVSSSYDRVFPNRAPRNS